jgi:arylsulfatase A-like enzyme
MAYRMQSSVPELADLSKEPQSTWDLYGPDAKEPGTFAYNCLMARRLAERGVRFTQVYKRGWDMHGDVPKLMPMTCQETDRGCYALVTDLKQRGMLDDTLVIWAGEFGRTVYSQAGTTYGETDDYSYNVVKDPVTVRDFNATILHCLGIDHNKLTYKFQGLDQKLTGPVPASVVSGLLA